MKQLLGSLLIVLFSYSPLAAQQGFNFAKSTDPMTDEDRSVVHVNGTSGSGLGLGWVCRVDGLNVLALHDRFLTLRSIEGQVRFPPAPPQLQSAWDILQGGKGALLPQSQVEAFTAEALKADTVVVRLVAPSYQVTDTFPLAGLQEALQKLPCAQPGAKKGISAIAGNEAALYNQGIKAYNDGKSAEARAIFEDIIRLAPKHANAHYQLGFCLVNEGKLEEAVKEFETHLSLDPDGENAPMAKRMLAQLKR